MSISGWTAQDHVKAVLAEFAVSGRGELLATLFSGHDAVRHGGTDTDGPA